MVTWDVIKLKKTVHEIDGTNLAKIKLLPQMTHCRLRSEVIFLKGEVYVMACGKSNAPVEKYSPLTKTWNEVADKFDGRVNFCACAFMDKIYMFGGSWCTNITNSCLQFDTTKENRLDEFWKETSVMTVERRHAACVVFQGNIVVSGGDNIYNDLSSVESYDVYSNKWSPMPRMINVQSNHSLVNVKDKLFVIGHGENRCEIF